MCVTKKTYFKISHSTNFVNNFIFKRTEKYFVYPNKELAKAFFKSNPKYKYDLLQSNLPRNLVLEKKLNYFHSDTEKSLIERIDRSKKNFWIFSYLERGWIGNI